MLRRPVVLTPANGIRAFQLDDYGEESWIGPDVEQPTFEDWDDDGWYISGGKTSNGDVNPVILEEYDDESYIPEFAVSDYNSRLQRPQQEHRRLQNPTEVTEPCEGDVCTMLVFSLELEYQTTDINLVKSDRVILFPFLQVLFREYTLAII